MFAVWPHVLAAEENSYPKRNLYMCLQLEGKCRLHLSSHWPIKWSLLYQIIIWQITDRADNLTSQSEHTARANLFSFIDLMLISMEYLIMLTSLKILLLARRSFVILTKRLNSTMEHPAQPHLLDGRKLNFAPGPSALPIEVRKLKFKLSVIREGSSLKLHAYQGLPTMRAMN